jgi:hypothetical protein
MLHLMMCGFGRCRELRAQKLQLFGFELGIGGGILSPR